MIVKYYHDLGCYFEFRGRKHDSEILSRFVKRYFEIVAGKHDHEAAASRFGKYYFEFESGKRDREILSRIGKYYFDLGNTVKIIGVQRHIFTKKQL